MTQSLLNNSRSAIIKKLSKLLPKLKTEYAISSLGLFGSYARNEQSENSDLDLLVEFNRPIGLEFFELKSFLEGEFNSSVDLVTKKALKANLAPFILQEVVTINES